MARTFIPVRPIHRPGLSLIEEEYWYAGPISERKAEEVLCKLQEPGSFLVRDSLLPDADYVLSVTSGKEIWHYEIQVHPNNECVFNNYGFTSLPAAVDFYTENRLGSVYLHLPAKPVVAAEDLPKTIGPQITVAPNPVLPRKSAVVAQHSPAPPPRTTPITHPATAHSANNTYDDIDVPDFPGEDEVESKPTTKPSVGWPAKQGGGGGRRDSGYSPGSGASSSSSQSHSPLEVNGHAPGDAGASTHFIASTPLAQASSSDDHTYCVPPEDSPHHTYDTPPVDALKLPLEEEICETTFDEDTLATTDLSAMGHPSTSDGHGAQMASGLLQHTASPQGDMYTLVMKETSAAGSQRDEEEDSVPSTFKPRPKPQREPPSLTPPHTSSPASSPLPAHPTKSPGLKAPVNRKAEQVAELKHLPSIQSMRMQLEQRMTGGEVESPTSPQGSPPTTPRRISIPEAVQNLSPTSPPIGVASPPRATQPKEAPVKKKHSFKILRRNSKKEEVVAMPAPIEEGSRQPSSVEDRRRSLLVATPISPSRHQQVGEFQSVFQSITKTHNPSVDGHMSATAAPHPTGSSASDGSMPVPMTLKAYSSSQPDVHLPSNSVFQSAGRPPSFPPSQPSHMESQSSRFRPINQAPSQRSPYTSAHGGHPGGVNRTPITSGQATHMMSANASYPLSLNQIVPGLSSPDRQQTSPPSGVSHLQRASTLPHLLPKPSPLQDKIEPITTAPMNTKRDKKRKSFRRRKTELTFK